MEHNSSLSARIRRRNNQGFEGIGSPSGWTPKSFGDYTDPHQNGKLSNILYVKRRKNYNRSKEYVSFTKKYADGKQKFSKIVKKVVKFVKDLLK